MERFGMDEEFSRRREAMVGAGYWRDRTLLDYLGEAVARTPDKEAIVAFKAETAQEVRLTYRALDKISSHIAANLRKLGIGKGDVVSFVLPTWWEFTALHLACLKIGAISNPLMIILRERELKFMLGQAQTRVLVVPSIFRGFEYGEMAHGLRGDLPELNHVFVIGGDSDDSFERLLAPVGAAEPPVPTVPLDPDSVIELLYTSGTTGEAKGVMHSSNTMLSNLLPFAERLDLGAQDVIHMPSPLGHQLGFMYGLVLPVMLGATAILQDIFDPAEMARQVIAERATFTMGATPFLNDFVECIERGGVQTPSLRVFVSAGAPIPRDLVTRARSVLGAAIVSGWGMSENGAVTTTRLDDPEELVTGTDGCALTGMEVRVLDEAGEATSSDVPGELYVRGCSNFLGYFKRPGLADIDAEGWFKTGDIARIDAQGYIRITGRSKDIIIRGGENIPVVEIEGLLYRHPAIAAVAIVGFPHPRLGEQACAFVVPRDDCEFTFADMMGYLKSQRIAVQYIPEKLEIVAELPITPSGKVQKFKLRNSLIEIGKSLA
jgi:cyclohexanecarboxylate-CoA ligase